MKPVEYRFEIKIGAIICALFLLYAFAAWAIWIVNRILHIQGSTFWMALFFMVLSHIIPKKYSGLPACAMCIATLYIWIFL